LKKNIIAIGFFLVLVAGLLSGCASNDWTKAPPQQANPTAPDLREEVDKGGSSINRPPWEK
jgi:hypothetical protein